MKNICKECDQTHHLMESYENLNSCEWCGGQIVKAAGCSRCTNCGWQGCGD